MNSQDFPSEWMSYGLNYEENRHSPLQGINKSNIDRLNLEWSLNLGTKRGIESTPLVSNGTMYFTGPWSIVYAVNAINGELLWKYDPMVPKEWGEKVCCDVVNRGLAIYDNKVYVGTLDVRLIAIDKDNGTLKWEKVTVDQSKPYSITGAPRIIKGNVIIGNGGADLGVRGYVTAYNTKTGDQVWRFHIVPGNPEEPFESVAMKEAAKTWTGEWWKFGGGGTAWDAFAFDPELNLLYVGTGNGSPWNRDMRSPDGGDNLYLSSILALNPDSGEYVWHYQTTPGDTWDYTATQQIILADLEIKGSLRKVLMQAPKNGFFYVIDRVTGEFISAEPYVYTNWAKKIDPKSGRPIETEFARYPEMNALISPSAAGGHNWQPMAFNSKTGLVYIPAREGGMMYGQAENWKYNSDPRVWNTASENNPNLPTYSDSLVGAWFGKLIAWDPINQKEVWSSHHNSFWNAGVLTTDELVFQGDAEGIFTAYDAESGEELWSIPLETGIIAAPVIYAVEGKQYVSILEGWGGVFGLKSKFTKQNNPGTLCTFALDGNARMPKYPIQDEKILIALATNASDEDIEVGSKLYKRYCGSCHGGGIIPDLKYSSPKVFDSFHEIVGDGILLPAGMPNFGDRLNDTDIQKIKSFIIHSDNEKRKTEQ